LTNEPEVLAGALRRLERCAQTIAPGRVNPQRQARSLSTSFQTTGRLSVSFSIHPPIRLWIKRLKEMMLQKLLFQGAT
jgi:hypothetical protein